MSFSESNAIHPIYGLNSLTNTQLAKCGEYGYTPEEMVNQGSAWCFQYIAVKFITQKYYLTIGMQYNQKEMDV